MAAADTLRYTRMPLTHRSGAVPADGFGTLIPDPLATTQATKIALEVGFRHLDRTGQYRNEKAVGDTMQAAFEGGDGPAGGRLIHGSWVYAQSNTDGERK